MSTGDPNLALHTSSVQAAFHGGVHPNSLGTFLFFAIDDRERDVIDFKLEGWNPAEALKWIGAAVFTLHAAVDAYEILEAVTQAVSHLGQSGPAPPSPPSTQS